MRTPVKIHMSSVERLYDDDIITSKEYESIMKKLAAIKTLEKERGKSG